MSVSSAVPYKPPAPSPQRLSLVLLRRAGVVQQLQHGLGVVLTAKTVHEAAGVGGGEEAVVQQQAEQGGVIGGLARQGGGVGGEPAEAGLADLRAIGDARLRRITRDYDDACHTVGEVVEAEKAGKEPDAALKHRIAKTLAGYEASHMENQREEAQA